MRLKDKVALITGGTSGIGEATALLFAREGAEVAITGRNQKRGAAVVARIKERGSDGVFVHADVSVARDCRKAVEETVRAVRAASTFSSTTRACSIRRRRWNAPRKSGTSRLTSI